MAIDFEKLRRINSLASNLKSQGIASSMDEAFKMAEEALGKQTSAPAKTEKIPTIHELAEKRRAKLVNQSVPKEGPEIIGAPRNIVMETLEGGSTSIRDLIEKVRRDHNDDFRKRIEEEDTSIITGRKEEVEENTEHKRVIKPSFDELEQLTMQRNHVIEEFAEPKKETLVIIESEPIVHIEEEKEVSISAEPEPEIIAEEEKEVPAIVEPDPIISAEEEKFEENELKVAEEVAEQQTEIKETDKQPEQNSIFKIESYDYEEQEVKPEEPTQESVQESGQFDIKKEDYIEINPAAIDETAPESVEEPFLDEKTPKTEVYEEPVIDEYYISKNKDTVSDIVKQEAVNFEIEEAKQDIEQLTYEKKTTEKISAQELLDSAEDTEAVEGPDRLDDEYYEEEEKKEDSWKEDTEKYYKD